MADLTTIRTALATQITNKTGLRALAQARDSVSPPVAVILPGQPLVSYGATMDGAASVTLAVLVIVSDAAPAEKTQRALDAYLGLGGGEPQSIPNAILADPSLGGTVNWCEPVTADRYGRVEWAGVDYFGARLTVTVGTI